MKTAVSAVPSRPARSMARPRRSPSRRRFADAGQRVGLHQLFEFGGAARHFRLELAVGEAQHLFRPLDCGDVDGGGDQPHEGARRVPARQDALQHPAPFAVRPAQTIFDLARAAYRDQRADSVVIGVAVVGMDVGAPLAVLRLAVLQADEARPGAVDVAARALRIADPDHRRRIVGDQTEAPLGLAERGDQHLFDARSRGRVVGVLLGLQRLTDLSVGTEDVGDEPGDEELEHLLGDVGAQEVVALGDLAHLVDEAAMRFSMTLLLALGERSIRHDLFFVLEVPRRIVGELTDQSLDMRQTPALRDRGGEAIDQIHQFAMLLVDQRNTDLEAGIPIEELHDVIPPRSVRGGSALVVDRSLSDLGRGELPIPCRERRQSSFRRVRAATRCRGMSRTATTSKENQ